MTNKQILQRINTLLGIEVKLEQMTLENGTVLEADKFEVGASIFIVTTDQKVPLPIGEYVMADGSTLEVAEEGVIGALESKAASEVPNELAAETVVEKLADVPVVEEMADVPATLEEILIAVTDAVKPMIEGLQAQIDELKGSMNMSEQKLSAIAGAKKIVVAPIEQKVKLSKPMGSNTQSVVFSKLSN